MPRCLAENSTCVWYGSSCQLPMKGLLCSPHKLDATRSCRQRDRSSGASPVSGGFPPYAWMLLDGVPRRFGDVVSSGGHGPPDLARGKEFSFPSGVLFHPVAVPALGPAIAPAGPAARLVRDVVLKVTPPGGAPA